MASQVQQNPYGSTFGTMSTAGIARPPSQPSQPYPTGGGTPSQQPAQYPYAYGMSGPATAQQTPTTGTAASVPGLQQPQTFQPSAMPNLEGGWNSLQNYANVGQATPGYNPSNYSVQGYQGPGQLNAYRQSSYDPGAYRNGAAPMAGPGGQMTFQNGALGGITDNATFASILQGLANPSRYGAGEVGQAYNVLNNQLTQQGNADYNRINEDMARRGLYASTTAGGRLGDLATNLNQQRADLATNLLTDQAKNYQSDRASAISQALGYGGQQFNQNLGGFNANLGAQGQNFGQNLQAGQFNEGLAQNAFQNNLGRNQFLLGQNAQNFGQQAQQFGANQSEAQNRFNSGLAQQNFNLGQNQQNFNQSQGAFQDQQAANQQTFNQLLASLTGQQGYQQQGFQNQLATQQMNNDQQQAYINSLLQMMGYTQ